MNSLKILERKISVNLNYFSIMKGLSNLNLVSFKKIKILDNKINMIDINTLKDYRKEVDNPLIEMYFNYNNNLIYVSYNDGNDNNDGLSRNKAFKTIQKAINTIQNGIILVYPGQYNINQSLLINEKNDIKLISTQGKKYTIINRSDENIDHRILTIVNSTNIYFIGFTLQNGRSNFETSIDFYSVGNGGGIYIDNNSFDNVIEDCIIKNCFSSENGGGIFIFGNSKVSRCIIEKCNSSTGLFFSGGAVIRCYQTPKIYNCLIIGCNGSQGAINCTDGRAEIYNCTVVNNGPDCGGIRTQRSSGGGHQVYNCISINNTPFDLDKVVRRGQIGGTDFSNFKNNVSSEGIGDNGISTFTGFKDINNGDLRLPHDSNVKNYGLNLNFLYDINLNQYKSNFIGCYNPV